MTETIFCTEDYKKAALREACQENTSLGHCSQGLDSTWLHGVLSLHHKAITRT